MDDRELWYSAGIIDGEGYIGIIRAKRSQPKGYNKSHSTVPYLYVPAVKVASVTESLIDYLVGLYGGYKSHRVHKNNQKESWMWEIKNWNRVEEFLTILAPVLRIKKPQAQVVLNFIDFRRNRRIKKSLNLYRYTEEEVSTMEEFHSEIRRLNFRGKSPATTE